MGCGIQVIRTKLLEGEMYWVNVTCSIDKERRWKKDLMERYCKGDITGLGSSKVTNFGIVGIERTDSAIVVLFLLWILEVATELNELRKQELYGVLIRKVFT
jgi:hypothetical protein